MLLIIDEVAIRDDVYFSSDDLWRSGSSEDEVALMQSKEKCIVSIMCHCKITY